MSEDLKTKILVGAVAVALTSLMAATASDTKENAIAFLLQVKMISSLVQAQPAQVPQPWIIKAMRGHWYRQATVWKLSCQMTQPINPVWDL